MLASCATNAARPAIEYGLIASLMGAAIVGGMNVWSDEVKSLFDYLSEALDAAI